MKFSATAALATFGAAIVSAAPSPSKFKLVVDSEAPLKRLPSFGLKGKYLQSIEGPEYSGSTILTSYIGNDTEYDTFGLNNNGKLYLINSTDTSTVDTVSVDRRILSYNIIKSGLLDGESDSFAINKNDELTYKNSNQFLGCYSFNYGNGNLETVGPQVLFGEGVEDSTEYGICANITFKAT